MSKKLVIVMLVLMIGVVGYLGYRVFFQKQELNKEKEQEKAVRELPDSKDYDPSQYVAPLKDNRETAGVFSDEAQVKGVVAGWEEGKVKVLVADKEYEVVMPEKVYLKCIPEVWTDQNGQTVNAKEVYIDFRNADKGALVDSVKLTSFFAEKKDILIQVKIEGEEMMTADMVVGFGCEEERGLTI